MGVVWSSHEAMSVTSHECHIPHAPAPVQRCPARVDQLFLRLASWVCSPHVSSVKRQRSRKRDKERERERERDRKRKRESKREREREKETEKETERETEGQSEGAREESPRLMVKTPVSKSMGMAVTFSATTLSTAQGTSRVIGVPRS